MPSNFGIAIEKTLAHEGGYVNDSKDPGGQTKYGISEKAYPHLSISKLTRKQAIDIYRRDYWNTPGFDQIENSGIAAKAFDLSVNIGVARTILLLQKAANRFGAGLRVDSILGPVTASAVNSFKHPQALLMALRIEAGNYYYGLGNQRFLAGWLNRLAE
ncbi:hypothetical protein DSCW_18330 [Desulfosarcina widdelii]|uniref:Uncharacterized protein n=1 Tax=Desulfosarcina widdelii TaxID=947919 RepID=A0A5K7YYF6_9BACT|nr:glycosyl hydrolase 108 family protein [Desulfosarcina widdelii]BBO74416.1 hypothetical protein DSCW_18330 [Desulfosarcina widdelii]